jgi:hypothetical protein
MTAPAANKLRKDKRRSPPQSYIEDFKDSPGGWWGWNGNQDGFRALEMRDGAVVSRSPWWVDYNHAPPGAGYLHMVFCLNTKGPFGEAMMETAGTNRFVTGGFSRNLTNATLTVSLKGELLLRGASFNLLVQTNNGNVTAGWVLVGQPLTVRKTWSEQSITLTCDSRQWVCLGSRHDRTDYYNHLPLEQVLADVNVNLMLILYPLKIVPMGPISGDPHRLRAGKDYPVWASQLPEGYIMMNRVRIRYPEAGAGRKKRS